MQSLLSKRGVLAYPQKIKADLTHEQRKIESLLLQERWSLMQSGTDKKSIKIRESKLFIHNRLHGEVKDNQFLSSRSTTDRAPVTRNVPGVQDPISLETGALSAGGVDRNCHVSGDRSHVNANLQHALM